MDTLSREYTLTELQTANRDKDYVNADSNDISWSPAYDTDFSLNRSNSEWQQRENIDKEAQVGVARTRF